MLQGDVRQFFPSIDHAILRDILACKIADADVMWLADRILSSGEGVLAEQYGMQWFAGDDLFAVSRPRGLPIGNLTSQFWANCYMNPFDHFVKRVLKCRGYVRYVDDMLLFADDKATLWAWREAVVAKLAELRLTIHPGAQPRPVTEGIPFLGFVVYPDHRLVKRRKVVHFRRRMQQRLRQYREGTITRQEVAATVLGWINHVRYADTWGLREAVLEDVVV